MRKVEVGSNFKVKGIKGLYLNPSAGRYWVRYCTSGLDRQSSFAPSNVTFSGLERRAAVELRALKKEVESELMHSEVRPKTQPKDTLSTTVDSMRSAIDSLYSDRVSARTLQKMKKHLDGFALVKSDKQASELDSHNKTLLLERLHQHTPSMREECFSKVSTAFRKLITVGLHKGQNPCDYIKPPQKVTSSREGFFTPSEISMIRDSIIDSEVQLFFELCCITGQRPVDVYRLNLSTITPNFKFFNTKTNRSARVASLIPDDIVKRCHLVGTWSRCQDTYSSAITSAIKFCFGDDDTRTLYHVRHSFLTNLRNLGNPLEDCKLWTHAGSDAAELHYIHESQDRANNIIRPYLESLGYAV